MPLRHRHIVYRDPTPRPWLMNATAILNRRLILPHLLRVRAIDLPDADAARLAGALDPGAVAFVAPNHPEFTTDWMLDKEISRRFAPRMAHWAASDIVHASPLAERFWLSANLIANVPGGGGRAYSVRWARAGHGVLLHPEGTATWCGDRIGALVPGIADMALASRAAEREEPRGAGGAPRPVRIAPVVWKLHFEREVGRELGREIDFVARALRLARPTGSDVAGRFAALHAMILDARCVRFGWCAPRAHPGSFFELQAALEHRLTAALAGRYGAPGADHARWLHGVRRMIGAGGRTADGRRDLEIAGEVERLHRFDRAGYGGPRLTQEQIAESLKRLRSNLLTRGFTHALHHLVPRAVAPRIARVRVPEPLDVDAFRPDEDDARARLLEALGDRMRATLAALNAEIAPEVERHARPNPWYGARARVAPRGRYVTRRSAGAGNVRRMRRTRSAADK